jgi:hypothetical protein
MIVVLGRSTKYHITQQNANSKHNETLSQVSSNVLGTRCTDLLVARAVDPIRSACPHRSVRSTEDPLWCQCSCDAAAVSVSNSQLVYA